SEMVYVSEGGLIGKKSPLGHFSPIPEDTKAADPLAHRVPGCPLEWEYGDLLVRGEISLPATDDPVLQELPGFVREFVQTVAPEKLVLQAPRQGIQPLADGEGLVSVDGRVCNDLGRPIREELLGGGVRRWSYDASGNLARYHDADGSTYKFEYASWDLRSRV